MRAVKQIHGYALRMPMAKAKALAEAQSSTGLSMNQLILLCVDRSLGEVVAALAPVKRITNVEPLSDEALERIYRTRKDESEGVSAEALRAMQTQEEPV